VREGKFPREKETTGNSGNQKNLEGLLNNQISRKKIVAGAQRLKGDPREKGTYRKKAHQKKQKRRTPEGLYKHHTYYLHKKTSEDIRGVKKKKSQKIIKKPGGREKFFLGPERGLLFPTKEDVLQRKIKIQKSLRGGSCTTASRREGEDWRENDRYKGLLCQVMEGKVKE